MGSLDAVPRVTRPAALVVLSLFGLCPLLLLGGCKDATEPPVATSLSIGGGTLSFSALGQTAQFTAQVLDQRGKPMPEAPVTWSSSAPQVVEIGPTGWAIARGNGAAQIRAVSGNASATRDVAVDQVAQTFTAVAGDQQTGPVGEPLAMPIRVRGLDSGGSPVVGKSVSFAVTAGGGTVGAAAVSTDSSGEAATTWTLGTRAGEAQEVRASLGNLAVAFRATAVPGPPASIRAEGGDGQTGYAMEVLSDSLTVSVADRFGNPTPGVTVTWTVLQGGGSLSPSARPTNAQGRVRAAWTLGIPAGLQRASAGVSGLTAATFSATALPNAVIAGTVTVTSGYLAPPGAGSIQRAGGGVREGVGSPRRAGAPGQRAAMSREAVPGELVVIFHEGPLGAPALGASAHRSPALSLQVSRALEAALQSHPAADRFEIQAVSPAAMAAKIRVSRGASSEEVTAALGRDPRVKAVEPNFWIQGPPPPPEPEGEMGIAPSGDELYPFQAWHYEMIGLPDAWEITTGSLNVTVAVVDDGIRFDHRDLGGNLTRDGYDFVEDVSYPLCTGGFVSDAGDGDGPDPDPTVPARYHWLSTLGCAWGPQRYGGHGTHVAGTVGALAGNGGGVGVNWRIRIRPVRVLGTTGRGTTWAVAQGILYAAGLPASTGSGSATVQAPYPAQVINLSLGSPTPSVLSENAVVQAAGAGALLVAAAGNDGVSTPTYPAAYPQVMAVSAVDPWGDLASYSNFGSWVEIAAPGGTTMFDFTGGVMSTLWDFQGARSVWGGHQGTSMAAPHVSGVAALLLAANPGLTAQQVRQRLTAHAVPVGPSLYFGAGLVNAFSSLTAGAGWPRALYVRLVNAADGRETATVRANPDGSFRFSRLQDGEYLLFAGMDERGDGRIGVAGRAWGALGGTATPTAVRVSGGGLYAASFAIGQPVERESNNTPATADHLQMGGYLNASLGVVGDVDWFVVKVAEADRYTFSTAGWLGACGMAAQANTFLGLYSGAGLLLASNDDAQATSYNYCARITASLAAGTYYLRVQGSTSNPWRGADQVIGYYRVTAQRGG